MAGSLLPRTPLYCGRGVLIYGHVERGSVVVHSQHGL